MKINLHTHSNYSLDADLEVNDLIRDLKKNGFDIISITDHDTCKAYYDIKDNLGLTIITGMEGDAIVGNHTYDFLCYGFDLDDVFNYALKKYTTVEERQKIIFDALIQKCHDNSIAVNDVESYNPEKEYAHGALFRMLDKSFLEQYQINSIGDLYRIGTIDTSFPLYIDMHLVWPDIVELVEVIHKNNGKVFLAHPYRYHRDVLEVLNDVKDYVDGIEICNNPESVDEVEFLYQYAKDNNLLVSCGSDYHGNDHYDLECSYLTEEMNTDIMSWVKKYSK